MKTKLITTADWLLLIDEDADIKINEYYVDDTSSLRKSFVENWDYWKTRKNYGKVIAALPLKGQPMLEGVYALPALDEDVEHLALNFAKKLLLSYEEQDINTEISLLRALQIGFKEGLKTSDKKYTENDMYKAMNWAISEYIRAKDLLPILDIDDVNFKSNFKQRLVESGSKIEKFFEKINTPIGFEVEISDDANTIGVGREGVQFRCEYEVIGNVIQGKYVYP